MIQSGSCPTLYLVLPCTLSLRKTLNSYEEFLQYFSKHEGKEVNEDFDGEQEDEGVKYIRQRILKLLFEMVQLDIRHYTATLLHPDYRSLKGCSNDDELVTFDDIKIVESEDGKI
ncbi:unnamed protein product [Rotaria sp. Silwood2]|nr:unnamed protein product [Rotaria sp. Silwood2]CAF4748325.1 unnamed protein product [Rotaria sp. Silwood2]